MSHRRPEQTPKEADFASQIRDPCTKCVSVLEAGQPGDIPSQKRAQHPGSLCPLTTLSSGGRISCKSSSPPLQFHGETRLMSALCIDQPDIPLSKRAHTRNEHAVQRRGKNKNASRKQRSLPTKVFKNSNSGLRSTDPPLLSPPVAPYSCHC